MGLDQYMYKMSKRAVINDTAFDDEFRIDEVAYWRKCYEIDDFFTELYHEKNPLDTEPFNCKYVRVTKEDLLDLKEIEFSDPYATIRKDHNGKEYNLIDYFLDILKDETKVLYYSNWW